MQCDCGQVTSRDTCSGHESRRRSTTWGDTDTMAHLPRIALSAVQCSAAQHFMLLMVVALAPGLRPEVVDIFKVIS